MSLTSFIGSLALRASSFLHAAALMILVCVALVGCGAPSSSPDAGAEADAGTLAGTDAGEDLDAGVDGGASLCTSSPLPCEDETIQNLDLKKAPAPGLVSTSVDGEDFISLVDATGGGFQPSQSYVYARFTDQGLEKVGIGDEAALASMDWDIALRRYVIRLNGGDSGPSCVGAARFPPGTAYASVTTVPSGAMFLQDDHQDESCDFVADGSGLPTSPNTALSSYYSYQSCVRMTGNVFLIQLASGEVVKLTVEGYYSPLSAQQTCQDGSTPTGATSAVFTVRWRFL
jgi:hypothetical protein